jgi:hypothetical protein
MQAQNDNLVMEKIASFILPAREATAEQADPLNHLVPPNPKEYHV